MTLVSEAIDFDSKAYIPVAVARANKRLERHLLRPIVNNRGDFKWACACGIGLANPSDPFPHLQGVRDADVPPRKK